MRLKSFIAGLLCLVAVSPVLAGSMTLLGVGKPTAVVAGFTGPADVVSGAALWYGLRAYSAADRGNKLVNVCNVGDAACVDMSSDVSTGNLVIVTVGGITCGVGANLCTIKIWYDRAGTNCNFGGGAVPCDLTQATSANRAVLTPSCLGSLPCAAFTAANSQQYSHGTTGLAAQAQPLTISAVAFQTTAVNGGILNFSAGTTVDLQFTTTPNVRADAGSSFLVANTTGAWDAIQAVFNNASSVLFINGASSSGTTGASGTSAGTIITIGNTPFSEFLDGKFMEGGLWGVGFNGTQQSNMNSNQRAYWGF